MGLIELSIHLLEIILTVCKQMSFDLFENLNYNLFIYKLCVCVCVCEQDLALNNLQGLILFTNPSAQAGYDTRSIFKWSLTGLNSEFSFS